MRVWGQKKYRPGAVWTVEREFRPFHFQIIGPSENGPNWRQCEIVHKYSFDARYNCKGPFTLTHLRKHAKLLQEGK